jgi:hypothetical protein
MAWVALAGLALYSGVKQAWSRQAIRLGIGVAPTIDLL